MRKQHTDLRGDATLFAALLAAGALVASLPWLRAYGSEGAHWTLVIAAPASVLVSAVAARALRLRAPFGLVLSGGALLLTLLFSAGFDLSALEAGVVHGPGKLLTETLPLSGSSVAAPAIVIVWISGALASETAFRARPGSHLPGLSLAVPVVSFVVAVAVAARAPGEDWIAAPALLVILASAALVRQRWTVGVTLRPYRAMGLSVLAAIALAAAIPVTPGARRPPVEVYEPPPMNSRVVIDPVAAFGSLRDSRNAQKPRAIMRVTTDAASDGYLTAAVLDHFDGSEWSFDSTFKPTGGRVPVLAGYIPPVVGTARVSTSATLLSPLPVPLLPVLERPTGVAGIPVAADAVNGMIAPDEGLDLPGHFTAVSVAPLMPLGGVPAVDGIGSPLSTASGAVASQLPDDLQLPPDSSTVMATAARFLAAITGTHPAPTVQFLQQAVIALRASERRLDPTLGISTAGGASGGTSLSQVMNAVTVNRSATPEQFATFLALVARYLGVPARVATGFRLQVAGEGILPAGSYTVFDREAWTWVEVPVAGMGWVVADPTPATTTGLAVPPPEQVQATPTTLPAPTANAVPRSQAVGGHAVAKPVTIRRRAHNGLSAWEIAVISVSGVMAALGAVTGGVVAARRRRTKRRFSDDSALLAGGAWLELLDALARAGMAIPDASTSSEIATEAGRHFGAAVPERVAAVGQTADRAICSVLDPPDREAALAAWEAQRRLARDLYRSLEPRQRARMMLTPARRHRWRPR